MKWGFSLAMFSANAVVSAVNAAQFADDGTPTDLGFAVLGGLLAIALAIQMAVNAE